MPLIAKSKNSVWRIWTGPWKVGKDKRRVGFVVATNIRTDKLPQSIDGQELEEYLINQVKRIVRGKLGE